MLLKRNRRANFHLTFMSRIRRKSDLRPPPGWEKVKNLILSLNEEMKVAEATNVDANSSQEQLWAVMRCNWQRSRPVFEMRWKEKTMDNTLYEWILNQGYADRELINAWRRPGYDRLCCVSCISRKTDHGGVCMCRVPKAERAVKDLKCFNCGCQGCCSGDFSSESEYEEEEEEA